MSEKRLDEIRGRVLLTLIIFLQTENKDSMTNEKNNSVWNGIAVDNWCILCTYMEYIKDNTMWLFLDEKEI